jgi:hypothetical protein
MRDRQLVSVVARCPSVVCAAVNAAMIAMVVMMPGEGRAFIYFQF